MATTALIIVVPCYNEEEALPTTHQRLSELLAQMTADGLIDGSRSRLLYVDDGSRDGTWPLVERLADGGQNVCAIKLAANSGHQNALMAGLEAAAEMGDAIVSIDADLQDDIHVIPNMVRHYADDCCDVVYGVRRDRSTDTWFKRKSAQTFYRLMRRLGVKSVYNHADFRLMSARAVRQLCEYGERNLFLRGIVPLIGYRSTCVYYDRAERTAGVSKYPLAKMVNFAIDGITSFSIKPVRMVFSLGLVFMAIALIILIYVLYNHFTGHTAWGWSSLILSIWFVGGCILLGLGIVGEYIGKIYIEVKHRPRYNVERRIVK